MKRNVELDFVDCDTSIQQCIDDLVAKKAMYEAKGFTDLTVESEESYGEWYVKIYGNREETPREQKNRLKDEERMKAYRRRKYDELSEEFG